MSSAEIKQAMNNVEKNKNQLEESLSAIRKEITAFMKDVKETRSGILEGDSVDVFESPLHTLGEFFFMGYYAGKMMGLFNKSRKPLI